ncbi:Innexin shaking-B [Eufriesea mexicana]|uniref:Innexin n=1 Tax=Eufriesea mexicana TaxID=516756 RepID=A0A310SNJ2_9HYME|nr:Innexin shaking-B [Eufriesea mexicana]
MLDIFRGLKSLIKISHVHIDTAVFRLHYSFTVILLISFSLIVTTRQYVGNPIDCIHSKDLPEDVLNTYCWIHSTYTITAAYRKREGFEVPFPGVDNSKSHPETERKEYRTRKRELTDIWLTWRNTEENGGRTSAIRSLQAIRIKAVNVCNCLPDHHHTNEKSMVQPAEEVNPHLTLVGLRSTPGRYPIWRNTLGPLQVWHGYAIQPKVSMARRGKGQNEYFNPLLRQTLKRNGRTTRVGIHLQCPPRTAKFWVEKRPPLAKGLNKGAMARAVPVLNDLQESFGSF